MAGSVNLALFDKTGTLTVDGLTFTGFLPMSSSFDPSEIISKIPKCSEIIQSALASCNSLSKTSSGKLIGDPLDIEIFNSTGWTFDQNPEIEISNKNTKISQIKTFPFSFDLKRQSSIISDGAGIFLVTKGRVFYHDQNIDITEI